MFHILAGILSEKIRDSPFQISPQDEEVIIAGFVQQLTLFLSMSKITYWKMPVSHSLWTHVLQLLSVSVQSTLGQRLLHLLTHSDLIFQQVAESVTGRFLVSVDMVQTHNPMHVQVYRVEMIPTAAMSKSITRNHYCSWCMEELANRICSTLSRTS